MARILISGLVNTETTVKVRQFPIPYYPIDYPFFGVDTAPSGVAWNIAAALTKLGNQVRLCSMTGSDFPAAYIRQELSALGIGTDHLKACLRQTPSSVVLYDDWGQRQIYCDLKDIQETAYGFTREQVAQCSLVVACNINFNRPLLALAKESGKKIATDVHVLSNIHDEYNRDFLECADLLFLSDEDIGQDYRPFLWDLANTYRNEHIVLGRGSRGAAMYVRDENRILELPAVNAGPVVNTVGAGDALFSSFLHFYSKGLPPLECLEKAQWFAAAKIRQSGAARGFVREAELEALINESKGVTL